MNDQLKKSILQTLAFFDIFNYPLTKEELYHRLFTTDNTDLKLNFVDFINQLEHQASLPGAAERSHGFYFLQGREEIIEERQRKVKVVEEKMKIAVRGIKKLRWVPFARAVFVCNTVAMGFADENSDIDIFIIVRKGRIWLARFLSALTLSLFGLRRTKNKIKNKICLSFYTTDDNLNLSRIAIEQPDLYLIYWIASLIPVYDSANLHQSILQANQWAEKYLVNGMQSHESDGTWNAGRGTGARFIKNLFEKMWRGRYGDMMEAQAKGIQQAKMKMNLQSRQNQPGTAVIISDSMLKFHENDRRQEYKNKWEEKCRKYLISPPALPCKAWRAGNI